MLLRSNKTILTTMATATKKNEKNEKVTVKGLIPLKGIGIYSAEELSKSCLFPSGKLWGFISLRVDGRTVSLQCKRSDLERHTMYAVSRGESACFITPVDGEEDEI